MHASCESPWHSLAKHCILDTCFLLTVPFRGMLLTPQGGPRCLAPTAHQIPVYLLVFSTFLYRAFTAHFHLDVGFVHTPADPDGTLAAVKRFFQRRTVFYHPALDGRVVDRYPALLHQFFNMPVAQGIGHVPPHTHENNILWKMGSLEADRHHRSPSLFTVDNRRRSYPKGP